MQYGIVIQPVATIYEIPAETMVKDGMTLSAIADEAMYGTGRRLPGRRSPGQRLPGGRLPGRDFCRCARFTVIRAMCGKKRCGLSL